MIAAPLGAAMNLPEQNCMVALCQSFAEVAIET